MRGDFDWQANSNGRKYLSAAIKLTLVFGNGKAAEAAELKEMKNQKERNIKLLYHIGL